VGNTLYGKVAERAPDPAEVRPYRADAYAPLSDVSQMPVAVRTEVPKAEYPREAARAGVEGPVILKLLIDDAGLVAEASVLKEPGHGLGAAAIRIAKKYFRFKPARRGEEAVATEIAFTVNFELP
jgi:protein TonB